MQCGAETDRRAQPAHRPEYLFRQPARHRHLPKQLEAFFKARDAYMAGRHLHNEALALGRWLAVLVAAAVSSGRLGRDSDPRPRKQVPLVLNLEIYDLLQALLRERQRQHRQECEKWQSMSGWALRSWQ